MLSLRSISTTLLNGPGEAAEMLRKLSMTVLLKLRFYVSCFSIPSCFSPLAFRCLPLAGLLALAGCFTNKGHQGARLYGQHCAGCHGEQGEGIGQLVPPLAGADYLAINSGSLACIVRRGLRGPIVVNGVGYDQLMLGVQDTATHRQLSPAQITNLLNYIETNWGNRPGPAGLRTIAGTEAELRACGER